MNKSDLTCCVIGSSSIIKNAELIDKHDIIVRINHGLEPEKKIGNKTSIYMYGSIPALNIQEPLKTQVHKELSQIDIMWTSPLWAYFRMGRKTRNIFKRVMDEIRKHSPNMKVECPLTQDIYIEMLNELRHYGRKFTCPTSGISTVKGCLQLYNKVSIIGFGGLSNEKAITLNSQLRNNFHNYLSENDLLREWIEQKRVILLD